MKISKTRKPLVLLLLLPLIFVLFLPPPSIVNKANPSVGPLAISCYRCFCCVLPGFTLGTSSASLSTPYNHLSDTATISASSILNYNGTITLTAAGLPTGATASFSPPSICVGVGLYCLFAQTTSTLTISASQSTPNGLYIVTVTGTSGAITNTVTESVNVPTPFVIVLSPPSIRPLAGQSQDSGVTVQSLFGFSGAVALTSSTAPSGPSVSFTPSALSITGTMAATSTLTFGPATLGNYSTTITGMSGAFTSQAILSATTTDFNLTSNLGSAIVQAGSPYTSRVDIGGLNGFAGTIHVSATVKPQGPAVSLSRESLTLLSGGRASTNVTILSSNSGTYTVNVTATSGASSHSKLYTINIAAVPPAPAQTIFGLAPMNFYGIVGGLVTAGAVGTAVTVTRRRKNADTSLPSSSLPDKPSQAGGPSPGTGAPSVSASTPASPSGITAPEVPKKGLSKFLPGGTPGLPKTIVEHKIPILLVSIGTALVVAALATISPQVGLFGGLFIPGILLLGVGSVVLFLQLYQRPVVARRFCMHCGAQMLSTGAACPRCNKQPMSGIDTRVCPNCNAVIPTLAKFCKDCGAGQPTT